MQVLLYCKKKTKLNAMVMMLWQLMARTRDKFVATLIRCSCWRVVLAMQHVSNCAEQVDIEGGH